MHIAGMKRAIGVVKEIQGATKKKNAIKKNPFISNKILGILEDYKTCGQSDRLLCSLDKKIEDCLICGPQKATGRNKVFPTLEF